MITNIEQFLKAAALSGHCKKAVRETFPSLEDLESWLSDSGRANVRGISATSTKALIDQWETLADQIAPAEFDAVADAVGGIDNEMMRSDNPVATAAGMLANSQGPRRSIDWNALAGYFASDQIEWKPVSSPKKGQRGTALFVPYVTARAVMDRLDAVCGPDGWQDKFTAGPNGGVMCGIGVLTPLGWIWKYDGADNSAIEAIKGGFSGALRRAAVHWGIGRYLYNAPRQWIEVNEKGEPLSQPVLPANMLPGARGKAIRWANYDELEGAGNDLESTRAEMGNFDNAPAISQTERNARKQAQNTPANHARQAPANVAPPSAERTGKPQAVSNALPANVPKLDIPPPRPDSVEGDFPKYAPGVENWDWALPDGSRRAAGGKVTNKDYGQFLEHYKAWGWGADAVQAMLGGVFNVARISALTYAEFCGAWVIITYAEAYNEYTARMAWQRHQREQERAKGRPAPAPGSGAFQYGG